MKTWLGGAAAVTLALVVGGVANAAPENGCPASRSGYTAASVSDVAEQVFDGLIDRSPWNDDLGEFTDFLAAVHDRNGDGDVCLAKRWGTRPAEQAKWYGFELFIVHDNTANASG